MIWLLIVIAAIAGAGYYAWSITARPWRRCLRCRGSGRIRDRVFKGAYGTCKRCGGRGRKPRLGVRVFTPARAKAMTARRGAYKKADHRGKGK